MPSVNRADIVIVESEIFIKAKGKSMNFNLPIVDEAVRRSVLAINGKRKVFCFGIPVGREFDYYKEYIDAYLVTDECATEFEGKPIYNVYDVALLEKGSFFVIVNQPYMSNMQIYRILTGYLLLNAGIDFFVLLNNFCFGIGKTLRDSYLGYNRYYNEYNNEYPGFKIFGDINAEMKIVTLGGSTSDPVFYRPASWSEILYYKLRSLGADAVIFAGGFGSYTSSNELLKFLRDVLIIRPNVVISYSGCNDAYYSVSERFGNRYKRPFLFEGQEMLFRWVSKMEGKEPIHGLRNNSDISEVWVENQILMTCMCRQYNMLHIPIFQAWSLRNGTVPEQLINTAYYGGARSAANYEMLENYLNSEIFANNVKKIMANHSGFYDFEEIFNNITGTDIYYDLEHVYEQGNEIIATNVLRVLSEKGCLKEELL